MKHMKMGSMPGDPCKMIPRPSQPHPNPTPNMTPEAQAAAAAAKKQAESQTVKDMITGAYKKIRSQASQVARPSESDKQSRAAISDRQEQNKLLKPEY